MTSPEMTSPEMMSQEPEIKGRSFPAKIEISWEVFPELLDSRYEQLNCESNLYRVTIDLLPPMLNHFPLLNCAISRD